MTEQVSAAVQAVLGIVFVAAGFSKIRDLEGFSGSVGAYAIVPPFAVRPLAFGLSVFELALGFAWFASPLVAATSLVSAAFVGAMAILIGWKLAHGQTALRCGCGGVFRSGSIGFGSLARDGVLICYALIPLLVSTNHQEPVTTSLVVMLGHANLQTFLAVAAISTFLMFAIVAIDEVLALREQIKAYPFASRNI